MNIDSISSEILTDFHKRRKLFDEFIKEKGIKFFTCPSCGYPTLNERGEYEICSICDWEDDNQDDSDADEISGGPNSTLSLTKSRLQIGRILCKLEKSLKGTINLHPEEVFEILSNRNSKVKAFSGGKISMYTNRNDPIWKKYYQLKKNSLGLLIKKRKTRD